jgi:ribosomal protein S18 acetylase RimI-like enzyme
MEAAEQQAREFGCTTLGLNVFGGNEVAIKLYESLGYRTTSHQMSKQL